MQGKALGEWEVTEWTKTLADDLNVGNLDLTSRRGEEEVRKKISNTSRLNVTNLITIYGWCPDSEDNWREDGSLLLAPDSL